MSKHHSISSYDKNLCLRPNITMWLIFLFLLRAYAVLTLSIVNRTGQSGIIDLVYPDRLVMSLGALAGVPAAVIIYAWMKRNPGAPPHVRNIWRKGRAILAVSALLNIFVTFVPAWMRTAHTIQPGDWVQFAIALMVVVVTYSSPYIRDCFNDFPADNVPADK